MIYVKGRYIGGGCHRLLDISTVSGIVFQRRTCAIRSHYQQRLRRNYGIFQKWHHRQQRSAEYEVQLLTGNALCYVLLTV